MQRGGEGGLGGRVDEGRMAGAHPPARLGAATIPRVLSSRTLLCLCTIPSCDNEQYELRCILFCGQLSSIGPPRARGFAARYCSANIREREREITADGWAGWVKSKRTDEEEIRIRCIHVSRISRERNVYTTSPETAVCPFPCRLFESSRCLLLGGRKE